ncbi:MAG TPA: hypothetical protein VJC00_01680 [Candidatus Nanoarchaeia archaeon]|nr:hypothetical protein [Candidatus Nanoarchaeia archaeon]
MKMRRYTFTWVMIMLVLIFSLVFMMARPGITGYSVLDQSKSYRIPVYMTTFIVLLIIIIILVFVLLAMNVHSGRSRIKEEESIRELLKNIK